MYTFEKELANNGKALMQDCKHIMHNLIKMSFYFRSDQWKWENFFAVFLTAI